MEYTPKTPEELTEAHVAEEVPEAASNTAEAVSATESVETVSNAASSEASEVQPKDVTVCDIQFRNNSKTYFFDPGNLTVQANDEVIIETSRGPEFGLCVRGNHSVTQKEVVAPLRPVIRLATEQDRRINSENRERETYAYELCAKKIADLKLEMQLVSVEYAFDGSKALFFFTADSRVDFRELVKILASNLRTRIELRQIGVRDKAKMVGGLGICGRPFCCREFLDDFQPVSIKMAKTQNLSLNPSKISGTCGRLMCCLNYEQEAYEDLLRTSPKAESFVDTPDGRGTVTDVNLLRQSVRVRLEKQPDTIVCHKNCDICVLRNGKAKKTDEPIPDDLAPISGGMSKKKEQEEQRFATYLEPVMVRKSAPDGAEDNDSKKRRDRRKDKSERKLRDELAELKRAESTDTEAKKSESKGKKSPGGKPEGKKAKPEQKAKREDASPYEKKKPESKRRPDAKNNTPEMVAENIAGKDHIKDNTPSEDHGSEGTAGKEGKGRKPYYRHYRKHRKPGAKRNP